MAMLSLLPYLNINNSRSNSSSSSSNNNNAVSPLQIRPIDSPVSSSALHHLHLVSWANRANANNNSVSPQSCFQQRSPQSTQQQQQQQNSPQQQSRPTFASFSTDSPRRASVLCIPNSFRSPLSSPSTTQEDAVATANTMDTDLALPIPIKKGSPLPLKTLPAASPRVFLFSSPSMSSFSPTPTPQHNDLVRNHDNDADIDSEKSDNMCSDDADDEREEREDNEGEKATSVSEALLVLAQSAEDELERDQLASSKASDNRSSTVFTFEPRTSVSPSTPSVHPLVPSPQYTEGATPTSATPPPRVDSPEDLNAVAQELSSLSSRSDNSGDEGFEEEEGSSAIAEEGQVGGKKRGKMICPHAGCHQMFTTRFSLKRHFKIHTGEKPWSCTVCRRVFAEKSTLMRHNRTHTREKPFKCLYPGCVKVFADRTNLKRHEMLLHTARNRFSEAANAAVAVVAAAAAAVASNSVVESTSPASKCATPVPPSPIFMKVPIAVDPVSKASNRFSS